MQRNTQWSLRDPIDGERIDLELACGGRIDVLDVRLFDHDATPIYLETSFPRLPFEDPVAMAFARALQPYGDLTHEQLAHIQFIAKQWQELRRQPQLGDASEVGLIEARG